MKFLNIIENYKQKVLIEQDTPPVPETPEQQVANAQPSPIPDEAEGEPDVPASIAALGNLLRKSLTLDISNEDRASIALQIPEIDEENATAIIPQIIKLMNTYSSSIDVGDNNQKPKISGTDDVTATQPQSR
jgi:hypothetical protein